MRPIYVDVSQALTNVNKLKKDLSPQMFNKVLSTTIRDTGNRQVKKIIKQETVKDYAVTGQWVGKQVMKAQYSGGGSAIACVIPIRGVRGTLGGTFSASGGGVSAGKGGGGKKFRKLARKGQIKAKILKGKTSVLPGDLKNQGGNPPFRLSNGAVMTRTTGKNKPIARVVGRSVPQMVDKHFEDRIKQPINDYIEKRFAQNVQRFMKI